MAVIKTMDIVQYIGESTPTAHYGTPFLVQSIDEGGINLARLTWFIVSRSPHEIQYAVDHQIINLTFSPGFFDTYFRFHSHWQPKEVK